MGNNAASIVESSYRALYGKLFAALFKQFGAQHVTQIEDALQNAFHKSLKSWKPNRIPENKEGWLFIVARNDVLNQIKRQHRPIAPIISTHEAEAQDLREDLRLKTLLYIATYRTVPAKTKVVFALKNIFGLHVKEISECTLLSQEAIYKSISRAKKDFLSATGVPPFDTIFEDISEAGIALVEEIIYAVFNMGFDSFTEKSESLVNEDLCLEALALGKML
ncbi:MAG: RNA polymerase, partial [Flavobacteriaceae bacterium]